MGSGSQAKRSNNAVIDTCLPAIQWW